MSRETIDQIDMSIGELLGMSPREVFVLRLCSAGKTLKFIGSKLPKLTSGPDRTSWNVRGENFHVKGWEKGDLGLCYQSVSRIRDKAKRAINHPSRQRRLLNTIKLLNLMETANEQKEKNHGRDDRREDEGSGEVQS